jgi:hypothetical protein
MLRCVRGCEQLLADCTQQSLAHVLCGYVRTAAMSCCLLTVLDSHLRTHALWPCAYRSAELLPTDRTRQSLAHVPCGHVPTAAELVLTDCTRHSLAHVLCGYVFSAARAAAY